MARRRMATTKQVEAAVKAHVWTVETVGTNDSFEPTWIWLPYRAKEALAASIEAGLLTIIWAGATSRDWPRWTRSGVKALGEMGGVSGAGWPAGTQFEHSYVAEAAGRIHDCSDATYLDKWKEIAGSPDGVVDQCLEDLRFYIENEEGKADIGDYADYVSSLSAAIPGLRDAVSRLSGGEPPSPEDSEQAVAAARAILSYRRVEWGLKQGVDPDRDPDEAPAERPTLEEAKTALKGLKALLQKPAETEGQALSALRRLEYETPAILHWYRTGRLSARLRRQGFFPPWEVGLGHLSGMRVSGYDTDTRELDELCGTHRWREARSRLVALHEEGNSRFDALDAGMAARQIVADEFVGLSGFYPPAPPKPARRYCVRCEKTVGTLAVCPDCGTTTVLMN